ncbi:NAD(P)H-dependent glycerol-3-phosphate dehydrogenase [Bacteroidota bacterium]
MQKITEMKKIAVIGSGMWGKALKQILTDNHPKKEIMMWEDDTEESLEKYVTGADLITIAVASKYMRQTCAKMADYVDKNAIVVTGSKALVYDKTENKLLMMKDIIEKKLGSQWIAALSGPNLAKEILERRFAATAIGSETVNLDLLKKIFDNYEDEKNEKRYFSVKETTSDIIGVELGGALKNIYAINIGIHCEEKFSDNYLGYVVPYAIIEMKAIGEKYGANPKTFDGLSGMGDLVATGVSNLSRNHKTGIMIKKGYSMNKIEKELDNQVAEGVDTCKAAYEFAQKNNINIPIIEETYNYIIEAEKR